MEKISRLKRNHLAEIDNWNPMGIILRDFDKKIVDKDEIEDISYGPSISREWDFEKMVDNPEWSLQSSSIQKI